MAEPFFFFNCWFLGYYLNLVSKVGVITQFKSNWEEKVSVKEDQRLLNKLRFVISMRRQNSFFFFFLKPIDFHDSSAQLIKVLMTSCIFVTVASCYIYIYAYTSHALHQHIIIGS